MSNEKLSNEKTNAKKKVQLSHEKLKKSGAKCITAAGNVSVTVGIKPPLPAKERLVESIKSGGYDYLKEYSVVKELLDDGVINLWDDIHTAYQDLMGQLYPDVDPYVGTGGEHEKPANDYEWNAAVEMLVEAECDQICDVIDDPENNLDGAWSVVFRHELSRCQKEDEDYQYEHIHETTFSLDYVFGTTKYRFEGYPLLSIAGGTVEFNPTYYRGLGEDALYNSPLYDLGDLLIDLDREGLRPEGLLSGCRSLYGSYDNYEVALHYLCMVDDLFSESFHKSVSEGQRINWMEQFKREDRNRTAFSNSLDMLKSLISNPASVVEASFLDESGNGDTLTKLDTKSGDSVSTIISKCLESSPESYHIFNRGSEKVHNFGYICNDGFYRDYGRVVVAA